MLARLLAFLHFSCSCLRDTSCLASTWVRVECHCSPSTFGLSRIRVSLAGGKAQDIKPHTAAGDLSQVRWDTMTCPFAWSSIGVIGSSGTEVKAVDRDPSRSFLLAANDKHEVCMFSYPAVEGASHTSSGTAHCSKVTNVCVMSDGKRAVSVGGRDLCCMVWYITADS